MNTGAKEALAQNAKPKPVEKPRDDWYFRRSTFPLRDAAPTALWDFWENQDKFARATGVAWQVHGPFNYAGRVTSLAVDPHDPDHILAGSAGGGLWRTRDCGLHWESIWPKYVNQSIGAVAFYPNNPGTIICATGEGNQAPVYPGSGIYISYDAGFTWQPYLTGPGMNPLSASVRQLVPSRIAAIAFGIPDRAGNFPIAFGSISLDPSLHAGLFMTRPDHSIGYVEIVGKRSYNCYDVAFHPTDPRIVFCCIETRGTLSGIWKSTDAGVTFARVAGLPPGETCGRISLAIAPSNPDILFALVNMPRVLNRVHGVFKSVDGGDNWTLSNPQSNLNERQLNYNNCIAIHPADPGYVVCGGTVLHMTRDGGATWKRITTGDRRVKDPVTNQIVFPRNSVHYDHHSIKILPGGRIYSGNDGGFAVSTNDGADWTERPNGMVTTMFYDLDVAASNKDIVAGGAQDAGTLISGVLDDGSLAPPGFDPGQYLRVVSGDGGWIVFDPDDPRFAMATAGPTLYRHAAGDPFAIRIEPGHHTHVALTSGSQRGWTELKTLQLPRSESSLRAFTILVMQPPTEKSVKRLWFATVRLRYSVDAGDTWRIASPNFDGSAISAVEFAAASPGLIFVGTANGGIFRSRNNGVTWSGDLSGPEIPRRLITQIEVHPTQPEVVVCTTGSTGKPAAALNADSRPFGHVFRSLDGGSTWQDIDDGALPNVVYNGLAFETHSPHRIFVGGDAGIWVYQDEQWMSITGSFPNVVVSDLIYHPDRVLTAATYGRGIWRLEVPEGLTFVPEPRENIDPELVPPIPLAGYVRDSRVEPPVVSVAPAIPADRSFCELSWTPVAEAIGYAVEVVFSDSFRQVLSTRTNSARISPDFGRVGVWRVWAILPDSRCTGPSSQASFNFKQPPPRSGVRP